ncbi:MAG: hypothetical protein IPG83_08870 [Novosphingobium sp.]|nr:hypothetical protein [Novosphingobium sp.]
MVLVKRRSFSLGLLTLGFGFLSVELVVGFGVWLMGSSLFYLDRRAVAAKDRGGAKAVAALICSVVILGCALIASRLAVPWFGGSLVLGAAFSLYAVHFPLVLVLVSAIPPGVRAAPDGIRLMHWFGVVLAATLASWLFSRVTEARTGGLRAWLRQRFFGRNGNGSTRLKCPAAKSGDKSWSDD